MPGWKGQSYPSNASHVSVSRVAITALTWWHKQQVQNQGVPQGCTSSSCLWGEPSVPPAPAPVLARPSPLCASSLCASQDTSGLRTHLIIQADLTWRSLIILAKILLYPNKAHPQVPGG